MKNRIKKLLFTVLFVVIAIVVIFFVIFLSSTLLSYYYNKQAYINLETNNYQESISYYKKQMQIDKFLFIKIKSITRGKDKVNYDFLLEDKCILAEFFHNLKDFNNAEIIYNELEQDLKKYNIDNEPFINMFRTSRVVNLMRLGYFDKAIEYTKNNNLPLMLIDVLIESNKLEQAKQLLFSKETEQYKKEILFKLILSRYYSNIGDYDNTRKIFEELLEEDKSKADYKHINWYKTRLVVLNIQKKDFIRAKEILEDLLQSETSIRTQIILKYQYAYVLQELGKLKEAENTYKEILNLNQNGYKLNSLSICSKYNIGILNKDDLIKKEALQMFDLLELSDDSYYKNNIKDFCKSSILYF